MDYVIVAALIFFSQQYIRDLIAVYQSGEGFTTTHWFLAVMCVAMVAFAVIYIIRIIKKFKNKDEREKEKAEREEKMREAERIAKKKRAAQYLPNYDEITDYDNLELPKALPTDESGEPVEASAGPIEVSAEAAEAVEAVEAAAEEIEKKVTKAKKKAADKVETAEVNQAPEGK